MFNYTKFFEGDIVNVKTLSSGTKSEYDGIYLLTKPISQCSQVFMCLKDGKEVVLDTNAYHLKCDRINSKND
jgi:hypothetical protein